jgi:transposase-like protein
VSRRSPFQVVLTADERRVLEARLRRRKAEQREVLWAQIAERLGIAPNTASKWRKRFFQEGLPDRDRPGRPRAFPPAVIAESRGSSYFWWGWSSPRPMSSLRRR